MDDRIPRIIRECFWDYEIRERDIWKVLREGDYQEKKHLFEKILLNSSRLFHDLELFDRKDLERLLEDYAPPALDRGGYAARRKNLAEVYFFDKPLIVEELEWEMC